MLCSFIGCVNILFQYNVHLLPLLIEVHWLFYHFISLTINCCVIPVTCLFLCQKLLLLDKEVVHNTFLDTLNKGNLFSLKMLSFCCHNISHNADLHADE